MTRAELESITRRWIEIVQIEDGRIVRRWGEWDASGHE